MAATDGAILDFDGTQSTVIATTGTIGDGIFTVAGTNATLSEFDNSVDLWPDAVATLSVPDTFAAVPDANSTIDLYMFQQDVDAALDEIPPTTVSSEGAHFVGSFKIGATDVNHPQQFTFSLFGVRKCKFAFQNNSGQTLSFSAGNTVKIEGVTLKPSA